MLVRLKDEECRGLEIRLRLKEKELVEAQTNMEKIRKSSRKFEEEAESLKQEFNKATYSGIETRSSRVNSKDV